MQALSKAALAILARLQQAADAAQVPVDGVPGVMMDDRGAPRGIADGGGYNPEDLDKRPDFIKEQTAGWDLLVTLSDRHSGRSGRS